MTSNVHIPKVLSCLLTPDEETGRWNGHCLDFDIVTSGLNEDAAWANLKAVVKNHVEECFVKWPKGLEHTASQDRWKCFQNLTEQEKQNPFRQEKIHFNLPEPSESDYERVNDELWIKGLQFLPKGIFWGHAATASV